MYLTVSGKEKNEDSIETAILLNFAGEEALEVFNAFQFLKGDEKKLDRDFKQLEAYCSCRKEVVFER